MSKQEKKAAAAARPAARLAKGFRDIEAAELRGLNDMLQTIRGVYERYGFEPLETPAIEYTDALGKFLPDQDRPNAGVFSFQDEDEQWLSLRYDLTAPLARYVAHNFERLPKPFRRYATGTVWRNEKPGPGRFKQFTQFDADTVGADSVAADAEICMLAADTLEALGIKRGDYVIKVNNRKVLDGLMELVGVSNFDPADGVKRLTVLRSLDKLDKLGPKEVALLLGPGRRDESGDFTKGAGLDDAAIKILLTFIFSARQHFEPQHQMMQLGRLRTADEALDENGWVLDVDSTLRDWAKQLNGTVAGKQGVEELQEMQELWWSAGYGAKRILPDAGVVRGLEYYTGPVFEAELTFQVKNEDGETVRFGSVGGGGRYDDLVARFTGQKVPATGFSIGVSRLQSALIALNADKREPLGPVVVTVMDKDQIGRYQAFAQTLRNAGIRAEMFLGNPKKFGRQIEYADKRNSPCVVIQGSNEREAGEVIVKDLIEGAKAAAAIKDNKEWKETRVAQVTVKEADLVAAVREILARYDT